jgi:hypothetical protein
MTTAFARPLVSCVLLIGGQLAGCAPAEEEEIDDGIDHSVTALACPEPGELPFPTESTDWGEDGSEDLLDGTRPGYGGFDLLGPISGSVSLEGTMGRADEFDAEPFEDEWVSLWGWTSSDGWVQHGREETESGSDGGEFSIDADAGALPSGDATVYSILEGNGHCAAHGVFRWQAGTQVIIADIDGTLTRSDGELFAWFDDADYVPREWPDAPRLMQTWDTKGYRVVYLTGRPHSMRGMTRPWLDALEFPYGPLSTATELLGSAAAVRYKAAFLNHIQDDLGWEIVAAYGNSSSDIAGYEEGGVPKDVTFTIGPEAGSSGTVSVGSQGWTRHIADYVDPYPDAT